MQLKGEYSDALLKQIINFKNVIIKKQGVSMGNTVRITNYAY